MIVKRLRPTTRTAVALASMVHAAISITSKRWKNGSRLAVLARAKTCRRIVARSRIFDLGKLLCPVYEHIESPKRVWDIHPKYVQKSNQKSETQDG